jgi:uncharacterized protein YjiS (DUF1127 family)
MYETMQRRGDFAPAAAESFGRIGRCYPMAAARRGLRFGGAAARSRPVPAIRALLRAVADAVRRARESWKRGQQASATYVALRALDARTLRDLGFDRSELASVAAECAGAIDRTRVRSRPR